MSLNRLSNLSLAKGASSPLALYLSSPDQAKLIFENFFASAPIGVALLDLDFRFVVTNRCLVDWAGIASEDSSGERLEAMPGAFFTELFPTLAQLLKTGESLLNVEKRLEPIGKPVRDVLASFHPVRNERGEISGIGMFLVDITERKKNRKRTRGVGEKTQTDYRGDERGDHRLRHAR